MTEALHFSIFREVNERIAEITGTWEWEDKQGFLCECISGSCTQAVWLLRTEYEAIRSVPTRFFTVPGHERTEEDRVVERHDNFVVVEKLGSLRQDAKHDDQRRADRVTESRGETG